MIRSSLLERVSRLYLKLHTLQAIFNHYDALPYEEQDHDYLDGLRKRINIVKSQLRSSGEEI
jgi:hypothetical protein